MLLARGGAEELEMPGWENGGRGLFAIESPRAMLKRGALFFVVGRRAVALFAAVAQIETQVGRGRIGERGRMGAGE